MSTAIEHQVRVIEVEPIFSVERPAGSFSFGAATAGDLTLAHVRVKVEDRRGNTAEGWGAIFLSTGWAFPGTEPERATKDRLMRTLVAAHGLRISGAGEWGHPLDHFLALEPELPVIAASVAAELDITEPIPAMVSLVALSPLDAAIQDAYGNLHGASSYDLLGEEHVGWDLSRVLGAEFNGRFPGDVLRPAPVARLPISHTVGATDPLSEAEVGENTIRPLESWIRADGVRSFKVKLKGLDQAWDSQRVIEVNRVARWVYPDAPVHIFADLNEQAPSEAYIHAVLDGVEQDPSAWAALDALEQPLSRHLGAGAPSLAAVSARVPVVLDEGLTSLGAITQAQELGWTGIALKTCKTQSLMLLALAKAQAAGMHVSVQDLTNPGIALVQSAGLAARLPITRPLESNARQYYPEASRAEALAHPELFAVRDGSLGTGGLTGPGLSYGIDRIAHDRFG